MSAPGPSSIPTSADPRSRRPTKKRALSPTSAQAASVGALFAKPDQDIRIPSSAAGPKRSRHAPPEIVANVQGSSAGAGSGEFHVYKASRRREYERLRQMDDALTKETEQEAFDKARADKLKKDEDKTRKNREKREKAKARKSNKGKGSSNGNGNLNLDPDRNQDMGGNDGVSAREKAMRDEHDVGQHARAAPSVGLLIHDDD